MTAPGRTPTLDPYAARPRTDQAEVCFGVTGQSSG